VVVTCVTGVLLGLVWILGDENMCYIPIQWDEQRVAPRKGRPERLAIRRQNGIGYECICSLPIPADRSTGGLGGLMCISLDCDYGHGDRDP